MTIASLFAMGFTFVAVMAIHFHVEDIKASWRHKRLLSNWIKDAIEQEECTIGEINVILCSDGYLLDMNKHFLSHDYYTDIITFGYSADRSISGDLYISHDRVRENALENKVTTLFELYRVVIHGVMHLVGYKDKSKTDVKLMREKENFYLLKLPLKLQ